MYQKPNSIIHQIFLADWSKLVTFFSPTGEFNFFSFHCFHYHIEIYYSDCSLLTADVFPAVASLDARPFTLDPRLVNLDPTPKGKLNTSAVCRLIVLIVTSRSPCDEGVYKKSKKMLVVIDPFIREYFPVFKTARVAKNV